MGLGFYAFRLAGTRIADGAAQAVLAAGVGFVMSSLEVGTTRRFAHGALLRSVHVIKF